MTRKTALLTLVLTLALILPAFSSDSDMDDAQKKRNETLLASREMTEQEFEKYKENPTAHPELENYSEYEDYQYAHQRAAIALQHKQRKAYTKMN